MALPINIEDLLNKQKVESNRIEFKAGWNPTSIYRSIGAFANDIDNLGGGYILVGVEEENGVAVRPVKGLADSQLDKVQREMLQYNAMIEPFYVPRISVEEVDGKKDFVQDNSAVNNTDIHYVAMQILSKCPRYVQDGNRATRNLHA